MMLNCNHVKVSQIFHVSGPHETDLGFFYGSSVLMDEPSKKHVNTEDMFLDL